MKKFLAIFLFLCAFFFFAPKIEVYAACADIGEACGTSGGGGRLGGLNAVQCCDPGKNGKPVKCSRAVAGTCVEEQTTGPGKNCIDQVNQACNTTDKKCCTTDPQGQSLFCDMEKDTCQVKKACVGKVGAECSSLPDGDKPQCCNMEEGTNKPLTCRAGKCESAAVSKPPEPTLPIPPPPPCADDSSDGKCNSFLTAFGKVDTNPQKFIVDLFAILLSISGAIALLLIMRAGYTIMTSQGKPDQLQAGREQFIAAVVGLLFLIFSFVILEVIGVDILKVPPDKGAVGDTGNSKDTKNGNGDFGGNKDTNGNDFGGNDFGGNKDTNGNDFGGGEFGN